MGIFFWMSTTELVLLTFPWARWIDRAWPEAEPDRAASSPPRSPPPQRTSARTAGA